MAVTRAQKDTQLAGLESAFRGTDTAILVDYRGLNVPQVTELRRQLRAVRAQYKVVKNTLAKRALKGTAFEPLNQHFVGTIAVAYTGDDPVALFEQASPSVKALATILLRLEHSPSAEDQATLKTLAGA